MPAPPLVTLQAAGEQRLFKHSTKPVKQRLFTTSTPKNSRKSCYYCHRWKSPWQQKVLSSRAVPALQDTRIYLLHHFCHPLLPRERWLQRDRLVLSLLRKDTQTHPKDSQTHPWPLQTSLSYPARKLLQSGTVKADREALALPRSASLLNPTFLIFV